MRPCQEHGFTLVELSIVLVVIGLIIGGILVGRDLIHASEIRAQVSQFEKYTSAVNTFRIKYSALPGDLTSDSATQLGFATRVGTVGRGDGNGLIEGTFPGSSSVCSETVLFFNDLSVANLIDGNFQGNDNGGVGCTGSSATLPVGQIIPLAKLGRGNYIAVYADTNSTLTSSYCSNYYQIIGGITTIQTNGNRPIGEAVGMTPFEAFQIDTKLDDGLPTSGIVLSRVAILDDGGAPGAGTVGVPSATVCALSTTTPSTYNVGYPDAITCSISFRIN